MSAARSWQVLLLGGASGVGKTSISYRLARHYEAGLTEVDDFQVVLEHMTSPTHYPELHYWRLHAAEARRMDEAEHLAFFQRYAAVMARALELVIANHIDTRTPVVLEGDFILPALAVQRQYNGLEAHGQVRALFLYEDDEAQLRRNYLAREGDEQPQRARISWRAGAWLHEEARRLGVPAIAARPWETVLERAIAVLDAPPAGCSADDRP